MRDDIDWNRVRQGQVPLITVVRNIKERFCEVSVTPLRQRLDSSPWDIKALFSRTDGEHTIAHFDGGYSFELGWERFLCGELLFDKPPDATGFPSPPLQDLVFRAAANVISSLRGDPEAREGLLDSEGGFSEEADLDCTVFARLLSSMVLNGGTACLPGLAPRLASEMELMLKNPPP